ncbi:outer membrane protein, cobalt-zinc-cadmium efflux system [Terriglobus roseus]|uniref:Outer membrane protein, cobalt-zinc-cadmium efflux system n=2 Tax=Terriglobus roseus TaxID=392734 RepID=A0A1G7H196_9BACT|nr:outer membrane protein, cobalt-zinc-cadmium efflux system [Terriglobus roseus]
MLSAQSLPPGETAVIPNSKTVLSLTLDQALAMSHANSPRLKEAEANVAVAKAGITTARAYSNPNLEVFAGRQYARPIATPGVPGLLQHYAGSQTIEIPSERGARRRAAEHTSEASHWAGQGILRSVDADTRHAFYEALHRREEIAHANENLQLVRDLLRRVTVEVDTGEKGKLELTRATAELARAQFAVGSAQLEYAQAIARLRAAIAAPAGIELNPRGDMEPRVVLPSFTDLRMSVFQSHPALLQSAQEQEAAKASLDRQKALRIPQPTAFAEFENQPDLRFWRTGITVPLPLFDRRKGAIEEAKATIARTDAVQEQRQIEITSALEHAYEQYQLADQQVSSLESGPLNAAESAVTAAQSAYRFGERGIVEVLDAQRVLQSVRGDLLDAQYARQSALVDLEELGAVAPSGVTP